MAKQYEVKIKTEIVMTFSMEDAQADEIRDEVRKLRDWLVTMGWEEKR